MDIQVPFLYFPGPFFQLPERWDNATHHEGGKDPADKENDEKQGDINSGDGLFKKPVYLFIARVESPGYVVSDEVAVVGGSVTGGFFHKVKRVVQCMDVLPRIFASRILPLAVIREGLNFRKVGPVSIYIDRSRFSGKHNQALFWRKDGNQPFGRIDF